LNLVNSGLLILEEKLEEERIIKKADRREKEKKNARKIHGPVPDLERYVDSQWWSKIFNKLYLKPMVTLSRIKISQEKKLICLSVY